MSHKRRSDGGFAGEFSPFEVHFVVAYYGVAHLFAVAQVGEFHFAQQADSVFGERGGVDDAGVLEDFLQEFDAADGFCLGSSCCPVLEVFTQVSLRSGF